MSHDREAEEVILAYGRAFSSLDGMIVLEDLRKSLCDRLSHVKDDPGGRESAFRDGERSVVLKIEALIRRAGEIMEESAGSRRRQRKAITEPEEDE